MKTHRSAPLDSGNMSLDTRLLSPANPLYGGVVGVARLLLIGGGVVWWLIIFVCGYVGGVFGVFFGD